MVDKQKLINEIEESIKERKELLSNPIMPISHGTLDLYRSLVNNEEWFEELINRCYCVYNDITERLDDQPKELLDLCEDMHGKCEEIESSELLEIESMESLLYILSELYVCDTMQSRYYEGLRKESLKYFKKIKETQNIKEIPNEDVSKFAEYHVHWCKQGIDVHIKKHTSWDENVKCSKLIQKEIEKMVWDIKSAGGENV